MKKEEVIELVEMFGLIIDFDQWDEKGWVRIVSETHTTLYGYGKNCLILYREDAELTSGRNIILNELRDSLIDLGKNIKARDIKYELGIV